MTRVSKSEIRATESGAKEKCTLVSPCVFRDQFRSATVLLLLRVLTALAGMGSALLPILGLVSVAQAQNQGTATPGSCVARDLNGTRPIPDGKKWYPVQIATSHPNGACRDRNVQIIELRGWIHGFLPGQPWDATSCNGLDPDWHYGLEVDTAWAESQGINLNELIRVGNIGWDGLNQTYNDERKVSTPLIMVEVFGWRSSDHPEHLQLPANWQFKGANGCPEVYWPFNPLNPTGKLPLAENQYVRIVGSLVTDEAHEHQAGPPTFLCGNFGVLCSFGDGMAKDNTIKMDWGNGINDQPMDPARPTEIHPPDLIENDLQDRRHKETLRGIAVLSEHCLTGPCAAQTVDEDIAPPAACPSGQSVAYYELVGTAPNETNFNTIEDGNAGPTGPNGSNTGAQITVGASSIHVHVMVRGRSLYGPYGRFKALYRVFCSVPPRPLSATATIVGQSPLTVAVTVTDPGTKLPVPGVDVWVDGAYQAQSGAKTPADGTVRLQFGACPQSGPQSIPGYRFRAPYPACPIHARSDGYQWVDLWTPVLAATGSIGLSSSGSNSRDLQVTVSDPLTHTNVGGAKVTVVDSGTFGGTHTGRTLASGTTAAADGLARLSFVCPGTNAELWCGATVIVTKAGYLNCSFAVTLPGQHTCDGSFAGATAAASTTTTGPAATAHTGQLSSGLISNTGNLAGQILAAPWPLSATVCPTLDGKSCMITARPPNSPLMDLVTVTSVGAPLPGATVAVSGQPTFTATTNASGVAVITHLACFVPGTGVPRVGQTTVPVRTPVPCQATASMAGYQPYSFTLP